MSLLIEAALHLNLKLRLGIQAKGFSFVSRPGDDRLPGMGMEEVGAGRGREGVRALVLELSSNENGSVPTTASQHQIFFKTQPKIADLPVFACIELGGPMDVEEFRLSSTLLDWPQFGHERS